MGMVHAEITLKNARDIISFREGNTKEDDIRNVTVTAVVNTGSMNLCITEELCTKLGLAYWGEKFAVVANGERIRCKVTEPVEVHWKNRDTVVPAMVIPGAKHILLGAIPLEGMDLMVNPVDQELVGVHGDEVIFMI